MKSSWILLIGASTALQTPFYFHDTLLNKAIKQFNGWSKEAAQLWDDVRHIVPEAIAQIQYTIEPKPSKKHNNWEYVVASADLPDHKLRVKKPKLDVDDVKQYSGYLDVEDDKHFFYWFFESRNDPKNDPIVLWLNGGPGCSSMTGLFMELGPSGFNKHGKLKRNDFSWNNNASVIFLDQPVNVGYSYSEQAVSNTVAAGKDVYALLSLFFKQFPEYKDLPFHIAGESYAGHYIPVFADEILSHEDRNINLQSIMIGNGLTDPLIQYGYYQPMACGKGGHEAVLSEQECANMESALPRCKTLIDACYNSGSIWSCVPASLYCNNAMMGPYQRTGLNVYDIRGECEDESNLCYPVLGTISEYLNRKDVMEELGAEVEGYDSCNFDINRNFLFQGDWMQPYHRRVSNILSAGLPVLNYAGDKDFICNWLGNQAWMEELPWEGKESYRSSKLRELYLDDKQIGNVKSNGNFTFVRVFDAGHMTPYNQPASSLSMFNRWVVDNDYGFDQQ